METYKAFGLELTLPEGKAGEIEKTFKPFEIGLRQYDEEFSLITNQEITPELCLVAADLRKKISKVRTGAEKARKDIKADVLQLSKAIDAVGNYIKNSVSEKEEKLKEIETHFERIEAERLAKIKAERLNELAKFEVDGSSFGVENMTDDVFNSFIESQKSAYETKKEQEKKAFFERMENERKEKEENERIRKENEELRKQQQKEREEKEWLEAELRKKQREEQEKARIEAAEKARIEAEEIARKQAPDKEKLIAWIDSFTCNVPEFSSDKFSTIATQFRAHLENLKNNAKAKL